MAPLTARAFATVSLSHILFSFFFYGPRLLSSPQTCRLYLKSPTASPIKNVIDEYGR
jgi:hypothetical protein